MQNMGQCYICVFLPGPAEAIPGCLGGGDISTRAETKSHVRWISDVVTRRQVPLSGSVPVPVEWEPPTE